MTPVERASLEAMFEAFAPAQHERWSYLLAKRPERWSKIDPILAWPLADPNKSSPDKSLADILQSEPLVRYHRTVRSSQLAGLVDAQLVPQSRRWSASAPTTSAPAARWSLGLHNFTNLPTLKTGYFFSGFSCRRHSAFAAVLEARAQECGLTPPSSGRRKGRFAPFAPPLMSNVRPQM